MMYPSVVTSVAFRAVRSTTGSGLRRRGYLLGYSPASDTIRPCASACLTTGGAARRQYLPARMVRTPATRDGGQINAGCLHTTPRCGRAFISFRRSQTVASAQCARSERIESDASPLQLANSAIHRVHDGLAAIHVRPHERQKPRRAVTITVAVTPIPKSG